MSIHDESYGFREARVPIDPSTTDLHNLALSMAAAGEGWMVRVEYREQGETDVFLTSFGETKYKDGDEAVFAEELGLVQDGGSTVEGYSLGCNDDGNIVIGFSGVPDERFSQTMQTLFDFSERLAGR